MPRSASRARAVSATRSVREVAVVVVAVEVVAVVEAVAPAERSGGEVGMEVNLSGVLRL